MPRQYPKAVRRYGLPFHDVELSNRYASEEMDHLKLAPRDKAVKLWP